MRLAAISYLAACDLGMSIAAIATAAMRCEEVIQLLTRRSRRTWRAVHAHLYASDTMHSPRALLSNLARNCRTQFKDLLKASGANVGTIANMMSLFNQADKDGSGTLTIDELKTLGDRNRNKVKPFVHRVLAPSFDPFYPNNHTSTGGSGFDCYSNIWPRLRCSYGVYTAFSRLHRSSRRKIDCSA